MQQHGTDEQRHGGAVSVELHWLTEVVCHPNGMMQQMPQMMCPWVAVTPSEAMVRSLAQEGLGLGRYG